METLRDETQHKIVYEDEGITKVLRGRILAEDEFTLTIQCVGTKDIIVIGKRALVRIAVDTSSPDKGWV